ncbi:MAG TPA: DNA-3-methyladenine glycosylase [Novimethylophilus sp.]|jgi:DNA-3-methyladenine glycosylase II|uniref:DNA-3-methyladenine glycosylase family protein n=1 Tax=Novimethylophilus sp. TaxID=2137426 RepID=UPI002F421BD0
MNTTYSDPAGQHLAALDPDWAALIARIGPCGLSPHLEREPFEALVRAIAYQQLHGRAAKAILARFLALYPGVAFPAPAAVLATVDVALRGCGFSAAKIVSIRGIAAATQSGLVPTLDAAVRLSDEELIARLITLRGVGRWTVEMLLMFALGRPDVLPVDDFGVREGWRILKNLDAQPKPRTLAEIGMAWSPYRSTAAWYLWRAAEQAKASATSKIPQL